MSFYHVGHLVALFLVGIVVAPIVCVLSYVYVRRPWRKPDTSSKRALYFYSALSGALIGQFVMRTVVVDAREDTFIIMTSALVAFLGARLIERFWFACTSTQDTIEYEEFSEDLFDSTTLDKQRLEDKEVAVVKDVAGAEMQQAVQTSSQLTKNLHKRRYMMLCVLAVCIALVIMDGFLVSYRQLDRESPAATVVAFYVNGIAMTLMVVSVLVHARVHNVSEKQTRLLVWSALCALWCVALICAVVPVVVGVSAFFVESVLQRTVFMIAYGSAGGWMLYFFSYYDKMSPKHTDRTQSLLSWFVFAAAAAQCIFTAYWL